MIFSSDMSLLWQEPWVSHCRACSENVPEIIPMLTQLINTINMILANCSPLLPLHFLDHLFNAHWFAVPEDITPFTKCLSLGMVKIYLDRSWSWLSLAVCTSEQIHFSSSFFAQPATSPIAPYNLWSNSWLLLVKRMQFCTYSGILVKSVM